MNITLLANRDIASNFALNLLLPRLSEHRLTVLLSSRVGGQQAAPQALRDLKFYEQGLFNQLLAPLLPDTSLPEPNKTAPAPAAPGLTMPATDPGTATSAQPSPLLSFAGLGDYLQRPVAELNNINSPAGLATFKASKPDLVVSIRYGVILRQPAIDVPTLGTINLHSGLLPDYRGVMASFWAMLSGASQLGTTLHFIDDASIDTGQIIAHSYLPVSSNRSYLWHLLNLYPDGCELIVRAVNQLAAGNRPPTHAQSGPGNYYSFPDEVALTAFQQAGLRLFDGDELLTFLQRYLQ